MLMKVVLIFRHNTTKPLLAGEVAVRTAGWTEVYYVDAASPRAAVDQVYLGIGDLTSLATARCGILNFNASLIGVRASPVSDPGAAIDRATVRIGTLGAADLPSVALLCQFVTVGANNTFRRYFRGLSDTLVVGGELRRTPELIEATTLLYSTLRDYRARCVDTSQPRMDIVSISAGGVISLRAPIGVVLGDQVSVLRSRAAGGRRRGGKFTVTAVADGGATVTVALWPWGATVGGKARKHLIAYPLIDRTRGRVLNAGTRKAGRPFADFRGRRSPTPR